MSRWIPVLVRAEDYAEVTALVAARESDRRPETWPADPEPLTVTDLDPAPASRSSKADDALASYPSWPESALRRLAGSDVVTAQRWARAMDVCAAAQPDDPWRTTTQIAELSQMSVTEWRDAPRKISRHLKANYRDLPSWRGHLAWPLLAWGLSRGSEVSWAMTPATRERWRRVRDV
ncbi:hypothetical protein GCM10011519_23390 [Marmoricola endophyticus]|uniref:Uncharacterized protein n=1 Tax=Marmoricola endophyticus TaxID=2040280 RepID=A0A917BJW8_9ACTN|nr:hypothetical protein [Marmoricola endophyticus]GGF48689.1 hypothetical protein GCM10011519_23390 [Marmoricola endophyticus]